jgi:hypothetical protein
MGAGTTTTDEYGWQAGFYPRDSSKSVRRKRCGSSSQYSPPLHDDQGKEVYTLSLVYFFGHKVAVETSSEPSVSSDDILKMNAISLKRPENHRILISALGSLI